MSVKERNQVEVKLQGSEIWKGEEFKDLRSIVQSSGDHGKEAKKHVLAGGVKGGKKCQQEGYKRCRRWW